MGQGQPDINAILAALNQQQSPPAAANASNQPHSASIPPASGMPFSAPGANLPAPNSSGSVSLPPPSSSGAFDLSSIRPANSGSVSLNDAIAKAQGMAADRGPRDVPNYRSRSRSPGRRDNYNPYRDERRGDRRGANGSDRPFSPGHNRGGRESRGSEESASDIIQVDSNAVGLIIGRNGENMRRIEEESGARVQFMDRPDNSRPKRQCKVTGTKRQRADAIADIFRSQAENHKKNSTSSSYPQPPLPPTPQFSPRPSQGIPQRDIQKDKSEMLVPDKTVGLIIGRGGETIRDIQERSRCHVNITSEKDSVAGQRPVNLIGDVHSRRRAAELINEIVDSDTRAASQSQQSQQSQPRRDPNPPPRSVGPNYGPSQYANMPHDQFGYDAPKENESMTVPSEAVGMIIGKSGETIKHMQTVSSCKINVSQPEGDDVERHIELLGTRGAISMAVRLIHDKIKPIMDKHSEKSRPGTGANAAAPYGGAPYGQANMPGYSQTPSNVPPQYQNPALSQSAPPGDPYAPYGGYNNYMAMWAAASANPGQGQPPTA